MGINLSKFNRSDLSEEQKEFLRKAAPLAKVVSEWVFNKCKFIRKPTINGIYPSLILGQVVLESHWGTHPVSRDNHNNRYSNNLSLLEANTSWKGKIQSYEDKKYRAYQNWMHFATDYSDYIVFSGLYDQLLMTEDYLDQLKLLSSLEEDSLVYQVKLQTLLDFYNLYLIDF